MVCTYYGKVVAFEILATPGGRLVQAANQPAPSGGAPGQGHAIQEGIYSVEPGLQLASCSPLPLAAIQQGALANLAS